MAVGQASEADYQERCCELCGNYAWFLPDGSVRCATCNRDWESIAAYEATVEAGNMLAEVAALPDREPGQTGNLSQERTLAPLPASRNAPGSVCMADIEPEEVDWVWYPYLPLGKLTILEGNPGEGKSWITAAIGAAISTGGFLPGAKHLGDGAILYFTAEDGLADTLRPRLDALEADCAKIFAFQSLLDLSTEKGLEDFREEIRGRRPMVVFIDPVVAFVGRGTDTYRANQVRSIMAPLAKLAEQHECAIVVVRHLSKAHSGRAIYRGQGSIDFVAAARSVLLVGSDPDEPENRGIIQIKCNLARLGDPVGFSLSGGRLTWATSCQLTAGQILGDEASVEGRSAQEEAEVFLREALSGGPKLAREIYEEAEREKVCSQRTLKTVKRRLGISSEKRRDRWYWVPLARGQEGKGAKGYEGDEVGA